MKTIPYRTTILTDAMRVTAMSVLEKGLPSYEGEQTQGFEAGLADYCGAAHGVTANSGTSALMLLLAAAEIGEGDEVVLGANDYVGCLSAIIRIGATPVFVDSEPDTGNIDPEQVEAAITEKSRAILATHLFGHPCDVDSLAFLARRHKLLLIEDFAHALGAEYKGARVGGIGDAGLCSFSGKHITVFGPGGIMVTQHEPLAEAMSSLRDQGRVRAKERSYVRRRDGHWYDTERIGFNMHMSEMSAALGSDQLQELDGWNALRRQHAKHLDARLCDLPLELPPQREYAHHAYLHYTIRSERRDELKAHLAQHGIETQVHYPIPLPRLTPVVERFGPPRDRFPTSDAVAKRMLSLPVGPHMSQDDIDYLADRVTSFFS